MQGTRQNSFKPTFEDFARCGRDSSGAQDSLTGLLIPAALAAMAATLVIARQPGIALLLAIAGLVTVGLGLIAEQVVPKADTILLIGQGPMASVIANTIEMRSQTKRPITVLRASTQLEAVSLVRSVECNEIIIAGSSEVITTELVDSRGIHPAIVSGPEKLEILLGRVPVELAVQDKWLSRLGQVRSLTPIFCRTKRAIDLCFSLVLGLIVLPLFPIIALAIRTRSRRVPCSIRRSGLDSAARCSASISSGQCVTTLKSTVQSGHRSRTRGSQEESVDSCG